MRDGVDIAVDIILPVSASTTFSEEEAPPRFPVVFHQTRYWRSSRLGAFARGGRPIDFINEMFKRKAIARAFAVVTIDVRGTGASHGHFRQPWSVEERADSLEVNILEFWVRVRVRVRVR
jgi:uncharacterized protein